MPIAVVKSDEDSSTTFEEKHPLQLKIGVACIDEDLNYLIKLVEYI
jgi:hypothetical protein